MIFLIVAIVAATLFAVHFVLHIDDPLATVVVSEDAKIEFTPAAVFELTTAALRQAGIEPVRPMNAFGDDATPESVIGRNVLKSNDDVTVVWTARNSDAYYTVNLERTPSNIIARVYRQK